MRLSSTSVSGAVGISVLPFDPGAISPGSAICMYCDAGGASNMTAQVDGTISDLANIIGVTYSQSTTSITVTFPTAQPHKLGSSADYCTISGTGVVGVDGTWPVASVTNDTVIVLTSQTSQTKSGIAKAVPLKTYQHVIASATVTVAAQIPTVTAANPFYTIPFSALILNVSAWATAGITYMDVRQFGSGS